jgi:hypothetical protein
MAKTTKKTATKSAEAGTTRDRKTPARKKTTAKKTPAKKATVNKTAPTTRAAGGKAASVRKTAARKAAPAKAPRKKRTVRQVTAEERHRLIAEAAYLRGEAQGFLSDEREDWLLAEAEIDTRLAKAKVKVLG